MTISPGVRTIGPATGNLLVHTGRAGVAGALGHDLTLVVGTWSATVVVGATPAESAVTATADLGSLSVRDGRGGAKPLTDGDRREILRNAVKALGRQAKADFHSSSVEGEWGSGRVVGVLTLHGHSEPIELTVVETQPGAYRAESTIRQTDFGIKPFSAMLGALRLADDVRLEITATL